MLNVKQWVVGMIFLLPTLNVIAAPNYNLVKSAKVNNLEMAQAQSYQSIQTALGKAINLPKLNNNECTGNPEASMEYKNKRISLEYFPENNVTGISLSNVHSKAVVWIYWHKLDGTTDKISLDNQTINQGMYFEQFKKTYPMSAKNGTDSETNKGAKVYTILLVGDEKNEEIPYRAHIDFTFVNNRLHSLSLEQGVAC